jgi:hypothetical protein
LKLPSFLQKLAVTPLLTRGRILAALVVALAADGFQLALGPLGWTFADEIMDVIAMILISWLIGFHALFLPTFAVEFIPVIDMLPTWTACTVAVIALRKREQRNHPAPSPAAPPVITKTN